MGPLPVRNRGSDDLQDVARPLIDNMDSGTAFYEKQIPAAVVGSGVHLGNGRSVAVRRIDPGAIREGVARIEISDRSQVDMRAAGQHDGSCGASGIRFERANRGWGGNASHRRDGLDSQTVAPNQVL